MEKTCVKCRQPKALEDFRKNARGHSPRCKPCAREDNNAKQARYRASPTNTIKLRYLESRYRITVEEFAKMETEQEGLCAICRKPPGGRWKRLHVDHDHATGKVRGLLCFRCNAMLGHAQDDTETLVRGARYLLEARVA